jgi:hypothetical protein
MGVSEDEVVQDESGREYVLLVEDLGDMSDPDVRERKKFLPEDLSKQI